jgi:putative membrane protein
MDFMKIALRDIGSIFKNRFIRISVVAIIVVPLLYSLLYLAAFWDPYSKLSSLPVAVVNLDKGTTKDGEKVNYGNDLVDKLKEGNKIGWQFVSLEEAEDKVKEKDGYYGMYVISEDFSKSVVSAKDGKPSKAQITFVENEKKSFLAAQINSSKVLGELKAVLTKNITKEYTVGSFDSLYELKDGMIKAADGSKELKDGMITAKDGSKELSDGLNTLNGKVPELKDGVTALSNGSKELSNGLNTLNGKLPDLKDGVVQLYDGSSKLNDGLGQVQTGVGSLYGGAAQINGGLEDAKAGATQINQGIKEFSDKAITPVASGVEQLHKALNKQVLPGMKQVSDGAEQVSGGVNELVNNMTTSQTAMGNVLAAYQKKVAEGTATPADVQTMVGTLSAILQKSGTTENQQKVKDLKDGAKKVSDGSKLAYTGLNGDFRNGLDGLNSNMPNVKAGVDKLDKGTSNLVAGLDKLYVGSAMLRSSIANPEQAKNFQASGNANSGTTLFEGVTALKDGASQLNGGLGSLKSKVPELQDGVVKLADGGVKLNDGLGQLSGKIPELQDGVTKLADGGVKLADGTVKLTDGATELSDKLKDGADKIEKNLINDSETMGDFVSEPLIVDEKPMNPVKDYGTGFAPYFIPLSLWVGAIMMFFVITDEIDDDLEGSSASLVLGKYFSYGFIGVIQAVLVSTVVMFLGLKPDSVPLYYLTNIVMSFAFIAIMQSLIFLMGQAGRLLSIVLLILQLTSCAGTFPIEIVPKLFKVLNPFMPFTYCVSALREVISGLDPSVYAHDITVLAVILVVFLIISVLMKGHADKLKVKILEKKQAVA